MDVVLGRQRVGSDRSSRQDSGQRRSSEDGEPARGNRQKMLVMLAPSRCKMGIGGFGGRVAREQLQAS